MPRVSRAETRMNRTAIEQASSRLVRERGFAVSVADVMGAVGLTPGGFYGHFASKDELNAVACTKAFDESIERWEGRVSSAANAAEARSALIGQYLDAHARTAPGEGCPMVALAIDVAREDAHKPVREAFLQGFEQLVEILASTQPADQDPSTRVRALAQMSAMVGALVLARATQDSPVSAEIIRATRECLLRATDAPSPRRKQRSGS